VYTLIQLAFSALINIIRKATQKSKERRGLSFNYKRLEIAYIKGERATIKRRKEIKRIVL